MIKRDDLMREVQQSLEEMPVTALHGPRQCGKTTLARAIHSGHGGYYYDMEDPTVASAFDNPKTVLEGLQGLIVIDEAQLKPELHPTLRVLVDEDRRTGRNRRFLLTGSASPELSRDTSESLAGRVRHISMNGFSLREVGVEFSNKLWYRGGFPGSFLASSEGRSWRWRRDFIETFLYRDLPQMGIGVSGLEMRRLWTMVAHLHGQLLNISDLGRSLALPSKTVVERLDMLEHAFVIRRLSPWFENLAKRQRKAPKLYIRDTGLLHSLLNVEHQEQLHLHPKSGASWEGFAIEQLLTALPDWQPWFWQTHAGAELDLLLMKGADRLGFEFKLSDKPTTTKSMHSAIADLDLRHLYVVHPGDQCLPLSANITALPLHFIADGSLEKIFR